MPFPSMHLPLAANCALVIRLSGATGIKEGPLDPRLTFVWGVDGLLAVCRYPTFGLPLLPQSSEGVSRSTTSDGWCGKGHLFNILVSIKTKSRLHHPDSELNYPTSYDRL
jgi:hypothetical protein